MEARLTVLVAQYVSQGAHRTGTPADAASALWLEAQMAPAGVQPELLWFALRRRDVLAGSLAVEECLAGGFHWWCVAGEPLHDCARYTDLARGVEGRLGPAGGDCDIAVVEYASASDPADTPGFAEARASSRHKAVVAVYNPAAGNARGLALLNASQFPQGGIGCPVLQVGSDHLSPLRAACAAGARAKLLAAMVEVDSTAANLWAEVVGSQPVLAPVLVLTPRSGWWACAVERGASLAAFLEIMRVAAAKRPKRTIAFLATSGHELGHLGNVKLWEKLPGYLPAARLCVHLGANWACAKAADHPGPVVLLQVSDSEAEAAALSALGARGVGRGQVLVRRAGGARRPVGEARELHAAEARYVSVLGLGNDRFHMVEDIDLERLDWPLLARLTAALLQVVLEAAEAPVAAAGPPPAKV